MEQDMRYVYQVYLEGSFSKAAEKLFLTQPALSIAIKKIETSIGMPLFDRGKRPMELTAAGKAYIDTIKQAIDLEKELEQKFNDIRNLNTGEIRIGGSHYLNAYILPKILSGFSQKYPGIRLELIEQSSAVLASMLERRELDLTFNCNQEFLQDFEHYPAFHDTILVAVPEPIPVREELGRALSAEDIQNGRHLLPGCDTVPLSLFSDIEFILLKEGNNLYDRSLKLFSEAGFKPRIKMTLSQLVTAYRLAEHGMAATFVSDRLVTSGSPGLRFYKLDSELIHRQFFILLPKRNYTSFAARKFIDYFLDAIKK